MSENRNNLYVSVRDSVKDGETGKRDVIKEGRVHTSVCVLFSPSHIKIVA